MTAAQATPKPTEFWWHTSPNGPRCRVNQHGELVSVYNQRNYGNPKSWPLHVRALWVRMTTV